MYVAETPTGRLWAYKLQAPGQINSQRHDKPDGGRLITGPNDYYLYDSLAVTADGKVCIATIVKGGITILDPNTHSFSHIPLPDTLTTNICFGGEQLRTAFITLSSTGKLISLPWATPGLPLNYLNK